MQFAKVITLARKELREIWRDKLYLVMAFIFPFMLMNVLGFGMNFDVEKLPFAILDEDGSEYSREYSHLFMDSRYFDYQGHVTHDDQADTLLKQGKIRLLLVIPPTFSERLLQGKAAEVQAQIDGMFTYRANIVKGYVSAINGSFNQALLQRWLAKKQGISAQKLQGMIAPVTLKTRYLYNNELKSIWSTGSGMLILIMLMAPALLTALGIVREKETGSIFNIYASTLSSSEYITGKLLPYVLISIINLIILSWVVMVFFDTPFKGSLSVYLISGVLYVTAAAGIGLLISTFVSSQAAAALIAMLGTMIPGMMYSGLIMPVASMSGDAQIQAHFFPGMYELQIVWGTYLKGQGWPELWSNVVILGGYALVLWLLAIWRFKKRVNR